MPMPGLLLHPQREMENETRFLKSFGLKLV